MKARGVQRKKNSPVPDQPNMFPFKIDLVVPVGSMQQRALKLLKPRNSRPSPIIQNATSIDENVAMIRNLNICFQILDFNIISALLMVPISASNLMLSLDKAFQSMSIRKPIKITENLPASSIHTRPIEFRLE